MQNFALLIGVALFSLGGLLNLIVLVFFARRVFRIFSPARLRTHQPARRSLASAPR